MHMTSSPGTPPGRLAANGLLESDLWIDRPDAADELARRVDRGEISSDEATHLAHFELGAVAFNFRLQY